MKEQSNQQNPENMNEEQLFLETRNGNIRSSRKLSTAKVEEGYCNEPRDKRPRLQKLQNTFKIKAIMQTANKAME